MLIEVWKGKVGEVYARPVNKHYRSRIREHLREMGVTPNSRAYFEDVEKADTFLMLGKKSLRELEGGWSIDIRMDDWQFLHAYGWDAHTLAESGILYKRGKEKFR